MALLLARVHAKRRRPTSAGAHGRRFSANYGSKLKSDNVLDYTLQ